MRSLLLLVIAAATINAGEHKHPVGVTDGVASLDVCVDGVTTHLLLAVVASGKPPRVEHRSSPDGGATWTAPVIIEVGAPPHSPARHNDLQIAARAEQVLATWSTSGSGFMGSGPLVTAISHDGGRSWSRGANPADDGSDKGHSFVDVTADGTGKLHAVWLDGRSGKQGLITSSSEDQGRSWRANRVLDARTCECCWNTVASDGDVVAVLYRAHAPRDMRLLLSRDRGATWNDSVAAGAFNWAIEACPHVGGGLGFSGAFGQRVLHAVVWTGAEGVAGVHHLMTANGGVTWSTPHPFPIPRARQASVTGDGNRVVVACTADDGSGTAVWCQSSDDGGVTWGLPQRLSPADQHVAHPKLVTTTQGIRVFWTSKVDDGAWTWQSGAP
jgi:BNR repeat-like domain